MSTWRVGNHYQIHVYEGDRPVATFHTVQDAHQAVTDHNNEFTPGRWWSVRLDSDNSLWCETSDEQEARASILTAPSPCTLYRLYVTEPHEEWRKYDG